MPRSLLCLAIVSALLVPRAASSREIESGRGAVLATEAEPATARESPEPVVEPLPQIGEKDELAVFVLRRGFYASADLGIFFTFAGTRGYSNVEPYVGVEAGLDIGDTFGVQASLAAGYASGNPMSRYDDPGSSSYSEGRQVTSYGLFMIGADLVAAIRPTARFCIAPQLGAGVTLISPQPTDPSDPSRSIGASAPYLSIGVDLAYLTLLTDFSAGASFTGYYVVGPSIPGLGVAFTMRYTF